ncbi:MAG TPA: hypothetical protein VE907_19665 [Gammaproteobacteria bacterium]|nr:hypothetical protein [Gammaproteobacteria bacterium]
MNCSEGSPVAVDPAEWIEIGDVAVRTRSVTKAAQIACKAVRTARRRGVASDIEWMRLPLFRELTRSAERR